MQEAATSPAACPPTLDPTSTKPLAGARSMWDGVKGRCWSPSDRGAASSRTWHLFRPLPGRASVMSKHSVGSNHPRALLKGREQAAEVLHDSKESRDVTHLP